jgi:hypothetical protein
MIGLDPRQAEVLATTLYVWRELGQQNVLVTPDEVVEQVGVWKQRRRPPVSNHEILEAIALLGRNGWVPPPPAS